MKQIKQKLGGKPILAMLFLLGLVGVPLVFNGSYFLLLFCYRNRSRGISMLLIGLASLSNLAAKYAWIMAGLGAAGGMMRFVGFATLLRIMLSNEFWGIYFAGFALATIIGYIPELSGSALLLIAFVGVAIALYDYQTRVAIKQAAGSGFAANGGDDEDGI